SGTDPTYREALLKPVGTSLTRAFTGRPARALTNRFVRHHDGYAPDAYPQVHFLTRPLRSAAAAAHDAGGMALWAGQSHALARSDPAATIVADLMP
ncbi:MAG: nitronate monooxygenase, partial [Actinocatenispora sp.]